MPCVVQSGDVDATIYRVPTISMPRVWMSNDVEGRATTYKCPFTHCEECRWLEVDWTAYVR